MKEYKIGDTVWTRKRGKGTITDHSHYTAQDRPWRVHFESCVGFYSPKAENLYPSEAAMNADQMKREAFDFAEWFKLVIDKASKPKPPRPPFASGGIVHDPHLRGLDFMFKPDPIQPKFKVGDAVYRNGQKYIVIGISGQDVFYYTIKNEGLTRHSVKESDLRYWRQTSFHTRVVHNNTTKEFDADRFNTQGFDMKKVKYIGHSHGSDIFIYNADTNHATILYGYKGDDI